MTVLHIDSSARLHGSTTRELTQRLVSRLGAEVIRRDLAEPLPLLTESWVHANFTPEADRDATQKDILSLSDSLIAELKAADTIVIGAPIYNFSVPASLKAWIDLVARAGVTLQYTENGPVGLLAGKKVYIVTASGGVKVGSEADFAIGYLTHVMGFLGLTDVDVIAADQVMISGESAIQAAQASINSIAA